MQGCFKKTEELLDEAVLIDSDNCVSNVMAGNFKILFGKTVSDYIQRAKRFAVTEKEKIMCDLLNYQIEGKLAAALESCVSIVNRWPEDLWIAKLGNLFAFYLGKNEISVRLGRLALAANSESHLAYGMLAFALEESGELEEAEELCRTALGMCSEKGDPWAEHTLAHILHSQGRIQEAAKLMSTFTHHWTECNSFMYTHNWWHYALLLLDLECGKDELLSIFDDHIWNKDRTFIQDQIMATSFLLILDLRKIDYGQDRLDSVVSYINNENEFCVELQSDLLRLWAFQKSGNIDLANKLLQRIDDYSTNSTRSTLLKSTYMPCAKAVVEFGSSNYREAVSNFEKCDFNRFQQIGASKEQSLLFIEVLIESLERLGQHSEEKKLITEYIGMKRIENTPFWSEKIRSISI